MSQIKIAPYGSWKSPITSDLIVKEIIGLSQLQLDGADSYWLELRPSEGGRQVIVRQDAAGKRQDITPPEFNARTRVHEYGGGDYVVSDGDVCFTNFADQQIYRQSGDGQPQLISKDCPDARVRYAEPVVDRKRNRLVCVREDHRAGNHEPVNELVSVPIEGGASKILVSGNDFYSSARVSPDGSRLFVTGRSTGPDRKANYATIAYDATTGSPSGPGSTAGRMATRTKGGRSP